MRKWYLQPWFLALLFTFSLLIVPFIAGVVLLVLYYMDDRQQRQRLAAEMQERDALIQQYSIQDAMQLEASKKALSQAINDLQQRIQNLGAEESQLQQRVAARRTELGLIDEEAALLEAGLYKPLYDFGTSERYAQELERIRQLQKDMVKQDRYANWNPNWTVNGSLAEGRRMNEQNKKMILRAFNNECDMITSAVNQRNFGSLQARMQKSFEQLNRLNTKVLVSLRPEYLALKVQELRLVHEYALKKEAEKEEQRRIREQMREEEKVRLEIERKKEKLVKERRHFQAELDKVLARMATASPEEQAELKEKAAQLEGQLGELAKQESEIEYYEKNTRAGFVYVISNIGSFGENVYKVGMTRRLVPEERVDELGDASVPFRFDIHAIIFSDDAPGLETCLHRYFEEYQVNKVNPRKEFFRVPLEEIERVVRANHDKTVEFVYTAVAEQYRETLAIERARGLGNPNSAVGQLVTVH